MRAMSDWYVTYPEWARPGASPLLTNPFAQEDAS